MNSLKYGKNKVESSEKCEKQPLSNTERTLSVSGAGVMQTAPKISAIILTCNRAERCRDVVANTARRLASIPAEIVVVNNGAPGLELAEHIASVPCRVLQMPCNLGTFARNNGWRQAKGDFILALDDDAYIDQGLPEAMLKVFDAHPDAGAVFFRVHDGKKEEACLLPTVFHGCACGFRRSALKQAGGYPKNFVYYGEEYHLSFRLIQEGFKLILCENAKPVYHARDQAGRNIDRIIRFLVRNNLRLWFQFLPAHAIPGAVADTLRWYRLVAAKEQAQYGFTTGCALAPFAIVRGLIQRHPLTQPLFEEVTLLTGLRSACQSLHAKAIKRVIICGVGKFPSLWLGCLKQANISVQSFLDHNTAWLGSKIQHIPVQVVSDALPRPEPGIAWLIGTASLAENRSWQKQLTQAGYTDNLVVIPASVSEH